MRKISEKLIFLTPLRVYQGQSMLVLIEWALTPTLGANKITHLDHRRNKTMDYIIFMTVICSLISVSKKLYI